MRDYVPLSVSNLETASGFHQPTQSLPERVTLESPATDVLTDFQKAVPRTIESSATIAAANASMIRRGVRLLLVSDDSRTVIGIVTANDILGERPIRVTQERGIHRDEVLVRDIMTPAERLEVLLMDDVLGHKVGHIVATLRKAGRQHALVVDVRQPLPGPLAVLPVSGSNHTIRGVFSVTRIARQLGVAIQTAEVARTFAEIESQFAH